MTHTNNEGHHWADADNGGMMAEFEQQQAKRKHDMIPGKTRASHEKIEAVVPDVNKRNFSIRSPQNGDLEPIGSTKDGCVIVIKRVSDSTPSPHFAPDDYNTVEILDANNQQLARVTEAEGDFTLTALGEQNREITEKAIKTAKRLLKQ